MMVVIVCESGKMPGSTPELCSFLCPGLPPIQTDIMRREKEETGSCVPLEIQGRLIFSVFHVGAVYSDDNLAQPSKCQL